MKIYVRKKNNGYQAIVSYKKNNTWRQTSRQGFKTRKQAKEWAENKFIELSSISYGDLVEKQCGIKIKDALEIFYKYKKNTVKETTYNNTVSCLKKLKPLYNYEVEKIKPIDIAMLFVKLRTEQHKTFNTMMKKTKTFFNFCINYLQIIERNPVIIDVIKTSDNRIKYINEDLYQQILKECRSSRNKLMIQLLYSTGMRYSEALGLQIQDIDIDANIITVSRQICRGKLSTLKTENSYRKIPITKEIQKLLKKECIEKNKDDYIFKPNISLQYTLSKYNTSPHCFRHTYATNLLSKGINLKVASELLGDTLDTFIKTYVQPSTDEREKAFRILSE